MPRILASSLAEHNDQAWAALTSALERLLAERSFDEITMASVASAAGMARNTLYNYAPDKASLVSAVTKRASAELLSEVTALAGGEGEPLERLEAITRAILRWFVADEHRHVVAAGLFAEPASSKSDEAGEPLHALEGRVVELIQAGIAEGKLRAPSDLLFCVQLLSAVMERAVHRVVRAPQDLPMVCDEALRLVRASVGPDPRA